MADRSITVHLKAEIGDYITKIGLAADKTKDLRSAVDKLNDVLVPLDKTADNAGDELHQLARKADEAGDQMKETAGDAGLLTTALKATDAAAGNETKTKEKSIVASAVFRQMFKAQTDEMWAGKKVVDESEKSLGRLSDTTKTSILNSKTFMKMFGDQVDTMQAATKKSILDSKTFVKMFGDQVDAMHAAQKATVELGDSWKKSAGDVNFLKISIEATEQRIRSLTEEFKRTGNMDLLSDLRQHRTNLSALKTLIPEDSEEPGRGFWGSVFHWSSRGLRALGGAVSNSPFLATAIGAAIVIGAPLIGAALSTAILGATGLGALAGGIALVAKDPMVAQSFIGLGQTVLEHLKGMASVFIEPLARAADTLLNAFIEIEPAVERIFTLLAPTIDQLAHGFSGFLVNLTHSLLPAFQKGIVPILNVLAERLPMLGKEIGVFFTTISHDEEIRAFKVLLDVIGGAIVVLGHAIDFLSVAFDGYVRAIGAALEWTSSLLHMMDQLVPDGPSGLSRNPLSWLKLLGPNPFTMMGIDKLSSGMNDYMKTLDSAGEASFSFAGSTEAAAFAAGRLARSAEDAKQSVESLFGSMMSADQANIKFNEGLLNMTNELHGGRDAINMNSVAGLHNRDVMIGMVDQAEKIREKMISEGQSVSYANDVFNQHVAQLRASAKAAGLTDAQIDDLIGKYIRLINLPNITKNIDVNITQRFKTTGERIAGAANLIFGSVLEAGGYVEHAEVGLLRHANIYAAGSRPMYAFAEPKTGGEGFVPRYGDYRRSTAIIDQEAKWYGGRFMPGGGGGSGGSARVVIDIRGGSNELTRWLRDTISIEGGGDVQVALGS